MTPLLRAGFVLCLTAFSSIACSNDDQSLGSNNLASTNGGAGGTASAGSGGSAATGGSAGSPSRAPTPRRICDGGDGISIGSTVIERNFPLADQVQREINVGAFFVDGQCHFWIINAAPDRPLWASARTGVLDEAEEAELSAALDFVSWPTAYGDVDIYTHEWSTITSVFDRVSGITILDAVGPQYPLPVQTAIGALPAWRQRLYEEGTPLTGPMRVRAVREDDEMAPVRTITLTSPLAALDIGEEVQGDSPLLTDANDLATLRALRAEYLATPASTFVEPLFVEDGKTYRLRFRDALPFENEHGVFISTAQPSTNVWP